MEQTVIKIGNSVGIIIPQPLRRQIRLRPGEKVVVEVDVAAREIVVRRKGSISMRSSVTPEFYQWLEKFNQRYAGALRELADR